MSLNDSRNNSWNIPVSLIGVAARPLEDEVAAFLAAAFLGAAAFAVAAFLGAALEPPEDLEAEVLPLLDPLPEEPFPDEEEDFVALFLFVVFAMVFDFLVYSPMSKKLMPFTQNQLNINMLIFFHTNWL
ncbi:hypothetical protein [Aridibaculum aurantiacum]|uniref:hypothetical protein n=1 Tax=Aridibaculum aurantiacum TaxID=2810307 RepID=UPI001F618C87|nr:hypothetical protein [Aridibaculum aurantiacum]